MTSVLLRNLPDDEIATIKAAAAAAGVSMQSYLREAVHAQAEYFLRQEALRKISDSVRGSTIPEADREAIFDEMRNGLELGPEREK